MHQIQQMSATIQRTEELKNELSIQEQRQRMLQQQQDEFNQQIQQPPPNLSQPPPNFGRPPPPVPVRLIMMCKLFLYTLLFISSIFATPINVLRS